MLKVLPEVVKLNRDYPYYEHELVTDLKELIEKNNNLGKNDIAFIYKDSSLNTISKTYQDFYNEVTNLSSYLFKNYKNKHLAIIAENSYNWIVLFYAIILSNNLAVVIDKDLEPERITKLLSISDTSDIFCSSSYLESINLKKYKVKYLEDIPKYINEGKNLDNKAIMDENKPAVIFFTSGTTGFNKAVMLSQKNICADLYGASSLFKPYGSAFAPLPFHHAFGLITAILKPFYYHVPVFINSSLKRVLPEIMEAKPNTIFVVPAFVETFYKQIWNTARKNKQEKKLKIGLKLSNTLLKCHIDLRKKIFKDILKEFGGNLEYLICGGAPLETKYVTWFRSIGIEILNGYGITECSPVVSVNRNFFKCDGSVGQVCKDTEVKIIDNEVCVKGNIVMLGYYKDKKATDEVIIDGYFHTGDFGYLDKDNFLFITGRKKNIIILSNGENISPEVIESKLLEDEGVCEVVVTTQGNHLVAYIYPNEDYLQNQEYFDNLIAKYNKRVPKNHQLALAILRTTEFKKNNNRKILRDRIMEE